MRSSHRSLLRVSDEMKRSNPTTPPNDLVIEYFDKIRYICLVTKLNQYTLSDFSTYHTGILQARAYRNLRYFMVQTLSKYQLTSAEWSLLGIIHEETKNGGIRVSDLANLLDVQKSFVTNMVRKLIAEGYAKHQFDEDDGRVRLIIGTDKAHLKVVEIESFMRQQMRNWLGEIDPEDLLVYIKVLKHLSVKKTLSLRK